MCFKISTTNGSYIYYIDHPWEPIKVKIYTLDQLNFDLQNSI
jgi:hypothetical protein